MIGVILAAGKGRRISEFTEGMPKSFLTIGGERLIDRQLESLRRIGIAKIIILIGYRCELFEKEYNARDIILLKNPFYESSNVLASLWFAREFLSQGFYFMHADTYFDHTILVDLVHTQGSIVLCVNKKPSVPEDMKVCVAGNYITEINKEMSCEKAYGEFTGLAKVDATAAPGVVSAVRKRIEYLGHCNDYFEAALQDVIDQGMEVNCFEIGKRLSIEIDFPEDYAHAQQLYASLAGAHKV